VLTIRELQRIAASLSAPAFEKQLGPFVLVKRPTDTQTEQQALQLGANRTVAIRRTTTDEFSLLFELDDLQVATLPPLAASDALSVGRLPDCDIVIDDPSVSKHHAQLSWDEPTNIATVDDLQSSNGTALNGQSVVSPTVMHDGDELLFGDARFCFLRTATLHQRLTKGRFK
jgi:hypothetical protein